MKEREDAKTMKSCLRLDGTSEHVEVANSMFHWQEREKLQEFLNIHRKKGY